jgi:ribosomal biogenesis protein LAS1
LKCIYWDRQTNSIPDVQAELRLRLHEIARFLKENNSKESKPGSKRKREYRQSFEAAGRYRSYLLGAAHSV